MAPSKKPLRVLYYEYPGRGVGGSRWSLVNLLRGLGDRVQPYIAADLPEEVVRQLPPSATLLPPSSTWMSFHRSPEARSLKTFYWWRYFVTTALHLAGLVRREGINLVHGNNEVTSNAPAVLAAMLTRRPYVSHLRGTEDPHWETRWLFRHVSQFIAISEHVRNFYFRQGLLDNIPVAVIYNGLDVDDLARRSAARAPAPPGAVHIAMFGRMIEFKGHAYFLEAARHVTNLLPEAQFTVHGPLPQRAEPEGVYYERVLGQCQEEGLIDRVTFAGPYSDVVAVMGQTDVVLCCSPVDNFGRILFEAMACGIPVVAFDAGGIREVAVPEENCLLVPNRDAEALAKTVIRLAGDLALRARLVEGGRETARRLFDSRANAHRVLEIYERLVAGRAETDAD